MRARRRGCGTERRRGGRGLRRKLRRRRAHPGGEHVRRPAAAGGGRHGRRVAAGHPGGRAGSGRVLRRCQRMASVISSSVGCCGPASRPWLPVAAGRITNGWPCCTGGFQTARYSSRSGGQLGEHVRDPAGRGAVEHPGEEPRACGQAVQILLPPCRRPRAIGQDCRIAATSNSSVTFSLTRTPVAAFQFTPQSLRLIVTLPLKPTRQLPHGSFSAPVTSKSTVTGLVTPRMVRSPVTLKLVSSTCSTPIEVKVMAG